MVEAVKMKSNRILKIAAKSPFYIYVPIASVVTICFYLAAATFSDWMNFPSKLYTLQFLPDSIWQKILIIVVAGPLLETLFLQAIPYHFLCLFDFFKKRKWLILLIAVIASGTFPFFSFRYFLYDTIMGFCFIGTYVLRSEKGDSFLCTYLMHVLIYGLSLTLWYLN